VAWVGLGQPSMVWVISPKNVKKIFSGWVKRYPGQGKVGLLFTTGQKQARVGSGQGPSLVSSLRVSVNLMLTSISKF